MGLIPQTFIDELIARADIVEVIGSRVQLKKAGREFKACCPFHDEKTASFWVSPEKQFYHCFGCGAHGTALRLSDGARPAVISRRRSRSSPSAGAGSAARGRERRVRPARLDEPLYELMAQVARFYAERCQQRCARPQYVAARGLDQEIVERFAIGYAPERLERRAAALRRQRRRAPRAAAISA